MKKSPSSNILSQQKNNIVYVHLQSRMAEVSHPELHSVIEIKLKLHCVSKVPCLFSLKRHKGNG